MSSSSPIRRSLHNQVGVGTATAGPGERSFGHIPVALPDGSELGIACWVVQGGRQPGAEAPVLYVHSTQHGNEITGIEVVRRVVQALDPRALRGTLIAVPIANPLAFRWRRHHYLQEAEEAYQAHPEKDMGNTWPGDTQGTHPQRLSHALWQHAVRHATHVLDLHTWNRWQAAATTVDGWHEPSLELAKAFGLWVQARWQPAASQETASRSLTHVAIEHGKAACSPNFTGQWDIYEPEVERGMAGMYRVLRYLDMLPASLLESASEPPLVFSRDQLTSVVASTSGIFLPRVKPEEQVQEGELLGVLVRQADFQEQEVRSPVSGRVYLIGAVGPRCDVALPDMMPIAEQGSILARLLPSV